MAATAGLSLEDRGGLDGVVTGDVPRFGASGLSPPKMGYK